MIRVKSPPKEEPILTGNSDLNERVPEEVDEEGDEEEEIIDNDEEYDEEGQQVYSDMLQRINSEAEEALKSPLLS